MQSIVDRGASLGLDVGSLFVHGVLIDADGQILARESRPHHGEVARAVRQVAATLVHAAERLKPQETAGEQSAKAAQAAGVQAVGLVGPHAGKVASTLGLEVDDQVGATLRGVQRALPGARDIIDAGGSSLALLRVGPSGEFVGYQVNTLCAAGTGSFLDEQAERLGVSMEDMAHQPVMENPPDIATRCAVFAKSDLIHRQQEGHGKPALWDGLCRGLARTMIMTLFKGRTPAEPLGLVGGVARNPAVVKGLEHELGIRALCPDHPETVTALGAALGARPLQAPLDLDALHQETAAPTSHMARRRPLVLERSDYPSFQVTEEWEDEHGTEVRVSIPPTRGILEGTLGVDVGSTSTKLALVNDEGQVVLDLYRKTLGDPVGATRLLLKALETVAARHGARLRITGVGTTGSGRKLVGAVLGADKVVNEISAHVTGAMKVDPRIDTIFEIGGQDAKYIHTVDGRLEDANMNYVCAAGTGSFVEELCRKLGFDLKLLGDQLLGVAPPVTSDRCTVFMEQDARHLLRLGFSPREVMGAVVASVVQNYLAKVVGNRPRSRERVFFQGATARNKALVAAFENLLEVEVVVSPFCHVMGAWGVALITAQALGDTGSLAAQRVMELARRDVKLDTSTCTLCVNRCGITTAHVEGLDRSPSWGYLCGRDPDIPRLRWNRDFEAFKARDRLWRRGGEVELPKDAPRVAMPRTLLTWSYAPLWRRFFGELGYRFVLSGPTDPSVVRESSDWVGADYCFPVKLAHGHARRLLTDSGPGAPRHIFLPFMISAPEQEKTGRSWYCPYNIGLPAMIRSAAHLQGVDTGRLLSPPVDLRWSREEAATELTRHMGQALGRTRDEIARAWTRACSSQDIFEGECSRVGRRALEAARGSDKPAVVVLGRPYNVFDSGANLALPEKLSRLGITVLPMDALPLDEEPLGPGFDRMFWNFGRRILEAARYIARTPGLHALGLTNFGCGPDSFIWSYVERIMGDKPMLVLELDEHGADAGYLTRLEAFADVLAQNRVHAVEPFSFRSLSPGRATADGATLWLPPMQEASPTLAAATLRRNGIKARALPGEDMETFLRGRARTRGGECLPCPATLGTYIASVEREGTSPRDNALFMPTAEGPCRFGQYCVLDRMLLEEEGWDPVNIISWSSTDSYDGLSMKGRKEMWTALVLGDLLYKMRCRVLPYERERGLTEALFQRQVEEIARGIEAGERPEALLVRARDEFMAVPVGGAARPLVGIVGEIYVRNNRFTNQDVVRVVEEAGGEAWNAPLSEWVLYVAWLDTKGLGNSARGLRARLSAMARNSFLHRREHKIFELTLPLLGDRAEPTLAETVEAGARYVPVEFVGETILTIGRAVKFVEQGASLVVNCSPFGCMPGAMTSGVLQEIEAEYGVPMATMFYDGEGGGVNSRLATYLANLAARAS